MLAVSINQEHLDRVGKLIGKIYSAQVSEKEVYQKLNVPRSTWQNVKYGIASESTSESVLTNAEKYVDNILLDRHK